MNWIEHIDLSAVLFAKQKLIVNLLPINGKWVTKVNAKSSCFFTFRASKLIY